MSTPFPTPPVDDRIISDLARTRIALPMLVLAREVGLFERLDETPRTIVEVADALGVTVRAAEAMVAVVAALALIERVSDEQFAVTAAGRTYFLPSSPFAGRSLLPDDAPELRRLREAFHAGAPIEPMAVEMAQRTDEEIRGFIGHMHAITLPAASSLARHPVFAEVRALLDVAGGSGSLCCGIAAHHPHIHCTLLDLPPVCAIARENIAGYGLDDRVATTPADMFEDPWPAGHDAILFGNIFHDWDEDSCRRLARRAFETLEPGGVILLHEAPLDDDKDGPLAVACFSVGMLLYERGKQYTRAEFRAMLEDAGFVDFACTPSHVHYHLVQARKPGRG
jgi:hypothetical protein